MMMSMTATVARYQAGAVAIIAIVLSITNCCHSYALRVTNKSRIDAAVHRRRYRTALHGMRHPTRLSYGSQLRLTVDDVNPRIDHDLPPPSVLCMGEILWDSLPSGIYMGGAPSNVAVHLASLLRQSSSTSTPSPSSIINNHQPTVAIAACLGNDQLGREAYRRLSLKGVRTDCIQFHEVWETGMATATLNESGDATYEFNTPAAWDGLRWDDRLKSMMQQNDNEESSSSSSSSTKVVIMGTIAARLNGEHGSTSSSTLATIRNIAREGISLVLDVNLRSPWYTPESVLGLARGVDASASAQAQESPPKLALLKLNEEELCILEEWCGLPTYNGNEGLAGSVLRQRMEQLGSCLNAQRICVTRGKDGAALLCTNNSSSGDDDDNVDGRSIFHENPGYSNLSLANNDCDSVGAGDAFLAALVSSLFLYNESPERALERACALGGYVAGCRGATPEHGDAPKELRQIFSFHG